MAHLRVRLRPLHRALVAASRRQAHAIDALATRPAHIGVGQVARWLTELNSALTTGRLPGERAGLTREEEAEEAALRARGKLPLDAIVEAAELTPFEQETLLLCAAIELDPHYGSVVAFLQDDIARRRPAIGFLAGLTAGFAAELPERRRALGRLGKLRRYGILRAIPAATEIDEELVLAPRVLDVLLGSASIEPRDPLEVVRRPASLPATVEPEDVLEVADAMRAGAVSLVGVWAPRQIGCDGVLHALAARLRMRIRMLPPLSGMDPRSTILNIADDAATLRQLLWIDCDVLKPHVDVVDVLARTNALVCLTGSQPLRRSELLAARSYCEITLDVQTYSARRDGWAAAVPELAPTRAADLAARYRLGTTELAAIANTARTAALLASNGHAANVADFVEPACAMLVQARSRQLANVVAPKRGLAEVVLAPELERQVTELVQAFRAWPRIVETWGLARAAAGGLKALFAGEPGTGKTLAAEAIAHELGLALVKIDLAQVVSKWVGETEKNLDIVFREAEDGNAVLFFDEAEALFGKRGEVRHGTDRYANLEVSYLLQRLESHDGLVVLASNLKGEIDDAFTRRFHSVLYFARPGEPERRRLWRLALPASVPLAADVDLGLLAKLDLTGAGIVAAVRTAALRAAQADAAQITASDLVFGIARQFQRESRLLTPTDLGRYGEHLRC